MISSVAKKLHFERHNVNQLRVIIIMIFLISSIGIEAGNKWVDTRKGEVGAD